MANAGVFPGSQAPDFKLQDENGNWVTLSELTARGPLMIAFYPGDFTPVCTKQLCAYQEAHDRFEKYGMRIVGVSANTPEEHNKFKKQYQFSFPLLSDPGKRVTKTYGVTSLFLLGGTSRAVFILAKGGKILHRYVEPTPLTHRNPEELLKTIDQLRSSGQI